jgi:hypothetical protein
MKPTKDKKLIEEITAILYGNFHTWKESSYYGLSKINQKNWRTYGEEITKIIEKLGYHKDEPKTIYNPVTKRTYKVRSIKHDTP